MVRIYKNVSKGGNGEFAIVTNETTLDKFREALAIGIVSAIKQSPGDEDFTVNEILIKSFPIVLKLSGHEADEVRETKQITCGYSTPKDHTLICEV